MGDLDATALSRAWSDGDPAARDRVVALLHDELHRRARGYLRRERCDHTLQPTALVNEAYRRSVKQNRAWLYAALKGRPSR
jgi:hypothetical protein